MVAILPRAAAGPAGRASAAHAAAQAVVGCRRWGGGVAVRCRRGGAAAASRPRAPRDDAHGRAAPGCPGRWGRRGASAGGGGRRTRPPAGHRRGTGSHHRGPPASSAARARRRGCCGPRPTVRRGTTQRGWQQRDGGAPPGGQVAGGVRAVTVMPLAGDQHPGQPGVAGQPPRRLGGQRPHPAALGTGAAGLAQQAGQLDGDGDLGRTPPACGSRPSSSWRRASSVRASALRWRRCGRRRRCWAARAALKR
jgi:hypothetical protein